MVIAEKLRYHNFVPIHSVTSEQTWDRIGLHRPTNVIEYEYIIKS